MASAGTAPAPVSNQPEQTTISLAKLNALAQVCSGARWFYWIAGLSLVNSVVMIAGGGFHFVVGLGITSVVDELAKQVGSVGTVLDLVINGTVAGIFFLFGSFAGKAQKWAFIVGMVLYGLDGLLLLVAKDVLSAAFHGYALYAISRGLTAVDQA
jgi:hypothetical protein